MPINFVEFDGDRVIKRYTKNGDRWTFLLSKTSLIAYSGRKERYERELARLLSYNKAGLPIPEYLSSDPDKLEIVMGRIPNAKNFRRHLVNNNLSEHQALEYLSKSAELLRQIHEHGGHGDPYLGNFLIGSDRIYAIDFEHQNKNGKNGELTTLFISALLEIPSAKEEIKRAVTYGYGEEPIETWTVWEKCAKLSNPVLKPVYRLDKF